jgi:hypothetical protein
LMGIKHDVTCPHTNLTGIMHGVKHPLQTLRVSSMTLNTSPIQTLWVSITMLNTLVWTVWVSITMLNTLVWTLWVSRMTLHALIWTLRVSCMMLNAPPPPPHLTFVGITQTKFSAAMILALCLLQVLSSNQSFF